MSALYPPRAYAGRRLNVARPRRASDRPPTAGQVILGGCLFATLLTATIAGGMAGMILGPFIPRRR